LLKSFHGKTQKNQDNDTTSMGGRRATASALPSVLETIPKIGPKKCHEEPQKAVETTPGAHHPGKGFLGFIKYFPSKCFFS
jgi:hypothetical protein